MDTLNQENNRIGTVVAILIAIVTVLAALVTGGGIAVAAFAAFGLASQALLVCYFAARRWSPRIAERFGWLAYAFAGLGLPLGVWLFVGGQSWRLYLGPILMASWALFGAVVDLWHPRKWRTPIVWNVLVPYVALYFWAQMFLWWPLWDTERVAWALFLVLFVANTALNLRGHFGDEPSV